MKYRFTNLLGQSTKTTRTYQIPLRLKTIKNIATKKSQYVYLLSYVPITQIKHLKHLNEFNNPKCISSFKCKHILQIIFICS